MNLRSGNIYFNPNDNTYHYQLRSGNIYVRHEDEDVDYMTDDDEEMKLPFYDWKNEIEKNVINEFKMYCDDIPDFPYRDCYDEGLEPIQVFNQIRSHFYRDNPFSDHMYNWWLDDIEKLIFEKYSVRISDFPNIAFHNYFMENITPQQISDYIGSNL